MANGDIHSFGHVYFDGVASVDNWTNPYNDNVSTSIAVKDYSSVAPIKWMEYTIDGEKYYFSARTIMCYPGSASIWGGHSGFVSKMKTQKCTCEGYEGTLFVPPTKWFTSSDYSDFQEKWINFIEDTNINGGCTYLHSSSGRILCSDTYTKTFFVNDGAIKTSTLTSWNNGNVYLMVKPSNASPIISGEDTDLGELNNSFSITYQVSDADADSLTVTEKLNGTTIRTLSNPPLDTDITLIITSDLMGSLTIGETNTIEIEVSDGSAISYRRYTFTKVNSAPSISGEDADLGQLTSWNPIEYTVADGEGDVTTVVEKINGTVIREFTASDETYTLELTEEQWVSCLKEGNILTIEATDIEGSGSTTTRTFTFNRTVEKIEVQMKNPIQTDVMATKVTVVPQWSEIGGVIQILACNNAFDESPTWEDITEMMTLDRIYMFTNETKTAENWGVSIKIIITKNEGYEGEVWLDGFGGAYE